MRVFVLIALFLLPTGAWAQTAPLQEKCEGRLSQPLAQKLERSNALYGPPKA